MKAYIVWILLLCAAFPLFAQSNNRAFSIYIPPVTGTGSKPEDNNFFYEQLVFELAYQNYNLAKVQKDADFSLVGTIAPYTDVGQYAFHLELRDNKTGEIKVEGELLFEIPDDIKYLFPNMVYTLLLTIPEETGKDRWRDKQFYFGAAAFWTPRVYTAESESTYFGSFGGGISAEFHFLDFLSVETGFEFASDLISVAPGDSENQLNVLMEIPLLIKYVIKPGGFLMLEPYTGFHFNVPFMDTTRPSAASWLIGFQYGIKVGPGVLFIDPRFSIDLGESGVDRPSGGDEVLFQRYIIHLGIGYKYGIITKD